MFSKIIASAVLASFLFSSGYALADNAEQNQSITTLPQVEVKAVPPSVICAKKAATHGIAAGAAAVVVDCLFFACGNTVVAALIGIASGGAEGCVEGVLEG